MRPTLSLRFSRLWRDCRANLAPTFALAMIPIFGFVGAAVDYSRANSARTTMLAALDSAALMLSKEAEGLTQSQLATKAQAYFDALIVGSDLKTGVVTTEFTSPQQGSFKLVLNGMSSVSAEFYRILGQSSININASTEVVWGMKRLEVALALDNTGSMASSGKLSQLKIAVHNLLDTLQAAAKKPEDVKVSIIPFDTRVKVGTAVKDEFWIDYTVNGVSKSSWTGCVQDRTQSNDVLDTAPAAGNAATLFPALNSCGTLTEMMPLSNDWTALHAKVDAMQANGNTNVTIGLTWAWHALTANLPLVGASSPQPDLDKVIILLTDGENTQNRWTTSTSSINARTALACTNIKAANIKLYTVRVIDGNATLLRNCATNPTMYYNVNQASQLNAVFSSIAKNLANLRLAK